MFKELLNDEAIRPEVNRAQKIPSLKKSTT